MTKNLLVMFGVLFVMALVVSIASSQPDIREKSTKIPYPKSIGLGYGGTVVRVADGVAVGQDVVTELRTKPADKVRVDHFASLFNDTRLRLDGWDCKVKSAVQEGDAIVYTVAVKPLISKSKVAAYAVGVLEEVHEFRNGTLTLRKAQPRGKLGYISH